MNRQRTPRAPRGQSAVRIAQLESEIETLRRELAEARARLEEFQRSGDAFFTRRIAELEEGQQVARGQAVEAVSAKSRAEGELRALQDAIGRMPGIYGWLLRKAQKRLPRS